jgi:hypothetical protein
MRGRSGLTHITRPPTKPGQFTRDPSGLIKQLSPRGQPAVFVVHERQLSPCRFYWQQPTFAPQRPQHTWAAVDPTIWVDCSADVYLPAALYALR